MRSRGARFVAGRASVLVTFEPHPLAVVNPAMAPARLTTAEERLEVLAGSRIDRVLVLQFDRAMSRMAPEAFVDQVLLGRCRMRELVIGHDHGFGHGRSGDVETLRRLGTDRGFPVDVVEPVVVDGTPVSSTAIRRAVARRRPGGGRATSRPAPTRPVPGWCTESSADTTSASRPRTSRCRRASCCRPMACMRWSWKPPLAGSAG